MVQGPLFTVVQCTCGCDCIHPLSPLPPLSPSFQHPDTMAATGPVTLSNNGEDIIRQTAQSKPRDQRALADIIDALEIKRCRRIIQDGSYKRVRCWPVLCSFSRWLLWLFWPLCCYFGEDNTKLSCWPRLFRYYTPQVALQFPDALLPDAGATVQALLAGREAELQVFIMADTSFGRCGQQAILRSPTTIQVLPGLGCACKRVATHASDRPPSAASDVDVSNDNSFCRLQLTQAPHRWVSQLLR